MQFSRDVWQLIVAQADSVLSIVAIASTCRKLREKFANHPEILRWQSYTPRARFITAAREGNTALIENWMGPNTTGILNAALRKAIRGSHHELIQLFIEDGANAWDEALYEAARVANTELIELCIERGAYLERGLQGAARGAHRELVHMFLNKGATNVNAALMSAASSGDKGLVEFFIVRGAHVVLFQIALGNAAAKGHKNIVEYLIEEHGVYSSAFGLGMAATGGQLELMKWLLTKGGIDKRDINSAFRSAARGGYRGMMQLLIEHGADDWNGVIFRAKNEIKPK